MAQAAANVDALLGAGEVIDGVIDIRAEESAPHTMALDAEKIIAMGAADYINIKLMKTGGLRGALRICALAEMHNVECFLGCMMESKISVTAAAHLACARSIITRCDLDSPALCSEDPVIGGAEIEGPWLKLSETPGLGIDQVEGIVWD